MFKLVFEEMFKSSVCTYLTFLKRLVKFCFVFHHALIYFSHLEYKTSACRMCILTLFCWVTVRGSCALKRFSVEAYIHESCKRLKHSCRQFGQ